MADGSLVTANTTFAWPINKNLNMKIGGTVPGGTLTVQSATLLSVSGQATILPEVEGTLNETELYRLSEPGENRLTYSVSVSILWNDGRVENRVLPLDIVVRNTVSATQ